MPRIRMLGLLLLVAGATRPLNAQTLTRGAASVPTMDPRLSETLRQRLSAGYDQRREPKGLLQTQAPDGPRVRVLAVLPRAMAELAQVVGLGRCPMPVAVADPRKLESMPVARADSTRLEKMPVAQAACVNPLGPK